MFKTQTLLYLCGLAATIGSTEAFSACGDARINGAFRAAVGREPTATECNAGRFAGGAYSSETELIPLVKASLVCSDPWIAQAYYKLGRPINGHDPTQLEGGRAGSTMDQCNYSIYGSWSNFPQLVQLVQNRATPAAPAAAGAAVSATITGPATLASAQSATVTWAFTGAPTACGSGVDLVMNGGGMQNYTMARIPNLGARSLSFQMLDWSRSFTTDTAVTLQLVDNCLGRTISASYATKITVVQALAAGRVRVTLDGGLAVVLNLLQRILDTDGNLFDHTTVQNSTYSLLESDFGEPDGVER
ncbi:MAG: hypothetical protein NTV52_02350 [Acidobacteria bacterium]|nr:hypothetical protein [Acidobacteriota bacterium]